ncbi:MAG: hypothetical protein NC938_06230 [Candidatus Omnitrophica bacterium]|nr:hypothetical protein [Candidatus Omnitrophota bacterium]
MDFFAKCRCSAGVICPFCLRLAAIAVITVFGALIAWKPKKTIDIQIALYRPFNWRLEPISWEKEIRNTRLMGLTLVVLGVASFLYVLLY